MNPVTSVCVPTYNGAKYFRECLDSILAQTLTEFELLIVDDHSSDDTLKIAQEYADRDARIRVTRNDRNLGLVGNWNRCIELAQGEWIKFVFQDDLIEPQCLEKMVAACEKDTAIVACQRTFLFEESISETTRLKYLNLSSLKEYTQTAWISPSEICHKTLDNIGQNFIGEPTVTLIRKSVFERFGLFNPHLIQLCDYEFWLRVGSNTGIVYVPELLASFRIHNESTSSTNHNQRSWRIHMDIAILIHEFMFNPIYANFRSITQTSRKRLNLAMLRLRTYSAWVTLNHTIQTIEKPDLLLQEWKSLFTHYSHLPEVDKFRGVKKFHLLLLRRFEHWQWQVQTAYKTNFKLKQPNS